MKGRQPNLYSGELSQKRLWTPSRETIDRSPPYRLKAPRDSLVRGNTCREGVMALCTTAGFSLAALGLRLIPENAAGFAVVAGAGGQVRNQGAQTSSRVLSRHCSWQMGTAVSLHCLLLLSLRLPAKEPRSLPAFVACRRTRPSTYE